MVLPLVPAVRAQAFAPANRSGELPALYHAAGNPAAEEQFLMPRRSVHRNQLKTRPCKNTVDNRICCGLT